MTTGSEAVIDMSEMEEDSFPVGGTMSSIPTVDMSAIVGLMSDRSVAATELASEVGSVVGIPKEAFLKSFTFFQNPNDPPLIWDMQLATDTSNTRKSSKLSLRPPSSIKVVSVEGCFELSRISPGDYLKSVNNKRIGPSYNVERAKQLMKDSLEQEGVLSVTVKNKEESADDILIHATIIKPKPKMTYEQMGMVVWKWGYLCIKSIEKTSIFKHTALKPTDQVISINEILCEEVTPEQVATILTALPGEITVTVLRRKQRVSGKFG